MDRSADIVFYDAMINMSKLLLHCESISRRNILEGTNKHPPECSHENLTKEVYKTIIITNAYKPYHNKN